MHLTGSRLAWFILLWCAGVGLLAVVALLLRWLMHAFGLQTGAPG